MDYQKMAQLSSLMKTQIQFIDYMADLIEYDKKQTEAYPEKKIAPIPGIGLLKSHFLTQKKACETVIAIADRHLPELKAQYDEKEAVVKVKRDKEAKERAAAWKEKQAKTKTTSPGNGVDQKSEDGPAAGAITEDPLGLSLFDGMC